MHNTHIIKGIPVQKEKVREPQEHRKESLLRCSATVSHVNQDTGSSREHKQDNSEESIPRRVIQATENQRQRKHPERIQGEKYFTYTEEKIEIAFNFSTEAMSY